MGTIDFPISSYGCRMRPMAESMSCASALRWIVAVACALVIATISAPAAECKAVTVRAEKGERQAAFVTWLTSHLRESGLTDASLLPGGSLKAIGDMLLYITDIDNDGADEYMLAGAQGSGGYLALLVFRASLHGWTFVKETPFDEHLRMSQAYMDPLSQEPQLFVRFCGRTYINLGCGTFPASYPETWVWEGERVRAVCNAEWMREQRRVFQVLFDRKLYREAYGLLAGIQGCASRVDPQAGLWMESDLALTALRLGNLDDCQKHVAVAQNSPAFASASAEVRHALATNSGLCAEARKKQATTGYDYSWLFALQKTPAVQVVLDQRFTGLLHAVVPECKDADNLRERLTLNLFLPSPAAFRSDRYVLLSGCRPHDCEEKGLVWVDTVSKRSIFGVNGMLGSRTVPSNEISREFWEMAGESDVPLWISGETGWMKVEYVEPDGTRTEITKPEQ